MKTIIAGSRTIGPEETLTAIHIAMERFEITEVVCGCATGPDTHGAAWASNRNIPVKRFPADWTTYGKMAGRVRNAQMSAYAEALVAVWDGRSRGTKQMIDCMERMNKKVFVYRTDRKVNK